MGWGIRSLMLGALAASGFMLSSYAVENIAAMDIPVLGARRGKNRHHGHSAGCAAHRRWKRKRASGINPRVRHG